MVQRPSTFAAPPQPTRTHRQPRLRRTRHAHTPATLAADTAYLLIRCDNVAALSGRTVAASFTDERTAALEIDGEAWYDEADDRWWQLVTDADTGALSLFMRSEALASSEVLLSAASPLMAAEEKDALAGMLAQA